MKWDDEIVKATVLTRDGAVVHPSFAPKNAAYASAAWCVRCVNAVVVSAT